jgi:hypothetical protein
MFSYILIAYFLAGLTFVFVGPAARLMRSDRNQLNWRQCFAPVAIPPWKLVAYSLFIALGIIIGWPILVVSAARIERTSRPGPVADCEAVEWEVAVEQVVSKLQLLYPRQASQGGAISPINTI